MSEHDGNGGHGTASTPGATMTRFVMRSYDESRLFGSQAWEDRRITHLRTEGKAYSRERELKRWYGKLHLMEDFVDRVNARGETATGRELSALMVNILDLRAGIEHMPTPLLRSCWRACVVGEARRIHQDGTYDLVRIPKQSHKQAAALLDLGSPTRVTDAIKRATDFLETFLF